MVLVCKSIKLAVLFCIALITIDIKAIGQSNDKLEAFSIHKSNFDPVVVYDEINGKVLAKIYRNEPEATGHIFRILESKNGWFRIDLNLTNVNTWVKAGSLAVNSRNYNQSKLSILKNPSSESKEVYSINYEATLLLLDISHEWLKIQLKEKNGRSYVGWINKEMACGNPYTTCN